MSHTIPLVVPARLPPIEVPVRPGYKSAHLRHEKGLPANIPEFTVSWMLDEVSDSVLGAISILCPGDCFSKKRGRRDSYRRLDALRDNLSLANDTTRLYFRVPMETVRSGAMLDIDRTLMSESPTRLAMVEIVSGMSLHDLRSTVVHQVVLTKCAELLVRKKPKHGAFTLTPELLKELDDKMTLAVNLAAEQAAAT